MTTLTATSVPTTTAACETSHSYTQVLLIDYIPLLMGYILSHKQALENGPKLLFQVFYHRKPWYALSRCNSTQRTGAVLMQVVCRRNSVNMSMSIMAFYRYPRLWLNVSSMVERSKMREWGARCFFPSVFLECFFLFVLLE